MAPVGAASWSDLATEALMLLQRSARDPAYGAEKAHRAVNMMRARVMFRDCNLGARVTADGKVEVHNQGSLSIGKGTNFMAGMLPTRLWTRPAGVLAIGEQCVFNYGVQVDAHARIEIGNRCLFGSMVQLCDDAFGEKGPIVLGDEVWVAHGAVIHPGVRIGNGAVISAGAVVTKDVPAGHLALGDPARAMKLETIKAAR
jgi:acetyltransferase-like isoleucine patch superfamily enzyme